MALEWNTLSELTRNKDFNVTEVRLRETGIVIRGEFELPPFGRLSFEDQVFVAEFIRCHGSIKEMEQTFGVSYPTIKSRLNKISEKLQLVQVQAQFQKEEVLSQLEQGAISVKDALERMKQ